MIDSGRKQFDWDFFSILVILVFAALQIIRLPLLPQSIDIHYHVLSAWNFIADGGYSGWDSWQYAPQGRVYYYPPFFHILLALVLKTGVSAVWVIKFLEVVIPISFLLVLWKFIRDNFGAELALLSLLSLLGSFTFFLSLGDHIPSTLAFIFGILSLSWMFKKNILRACMLLILCFYTHIGVSYFFALTILLYGLLDRNNRPACLKILCLAVLFALPVIIKEILALKYISKLGIDLAETYSPRVKIFNYLLALFGLILIWRQEKKYLIFLSFFISSFIFLTYPYRFFSVEGYFPIGLLSAVFLLFLWKASGRKKYFVHLFLFFIFIVFIFSPTYNFGINNVDTINKRIDVGFRLRIFDSALLKMALAKGGSIWYPKDYASAVKIVQDNSSKTGIVYSTLDYAGIAIGSLAGRPVANGLLPEEGAARRFDPFLSSQIIVFTRLDKDEIIERAVSYYHLDKIGENKLFLFYKNPSSGMEAVSPKAALPFWMICPGLGLFLLVFWKGSFFKKYLTR